NRGGLNEVIHLAARHLVSGCNLVRAGKWRGGADENWEVYCEYPQTDN
ncbi:unnamed protein product, partial [marine sediment metagenome]